MSKAQNEAGVNSSEALQHRAWFLWPQPEGKGVKTAPLCVALLAQTPSLGVVARLDWRCFNRFSHLQK
ncbi:MAG: hypothetical protein Q8M68_08140 [Polaromonas sp.]|nr:hypothetical protein [Polaromonas sp.]